MTASIGKMYTFNWQFFSFPHSKKNDISRVDIFIDKRYIIEQA